MPELQPPSWGNEGLRSPSGRVVPFGAESPGSIVHVIDFGGLVTGETFVTVEARKAKHGGGLLVKAEAVDPRVFDTEEPFPSAVRLQFPDIQMPPRPDQEQQYLSALQATGELALQGLEAILSSNTSTGGNA